MRISDWSSDVCSSDLGTDVAVDDVRHLAMLHGPDDLALNLHRYHAGAGGLRLKFYRQSDDIPLSDALPMMENMGLRVITAHPYQLRIDEGVTFLPDFPVEATPEFAIAPTGSAHQDALPPLGPGTPDNA